MSDRPRWPSFVCEPGYGGGFPAVEIAAIFVYRVRFLDQAKLFVGASCPARAIDLAVLKHVQRGGSGFVENVEYLGELESLEDTRS